MIIKSINISNYGPFSTSTFIQLDPEVTVLTGANDTGKTSLLRFVEMVWTRGTITEDEANIDRTLTSTVPWDQDTDVACVMQFQATPLSNKYMQRQELKDNSVFQVTFRFPPTGASRNIDYIQNGDSKTNIGKPITGNPKVLFISSETAQINPVINLEGPNAIEQKLLLLAFGHNPLEKLRKMSPWKLASALETANQQLNAALSRVIPKILKYEVKFQKAEGSNYFGLTLLFRDQSSGSAPIHLRGTGLRKLVNLVCMLLDRDFENNFTYILIDEPENSLHADAQHMFRRFLEELGKQENVQVIYTTHSPAMINPLRGDRVRLFTRETINGVATTRVNNHPFDDNFLPIRSSLGMSPADSLIYGPVTIVTEGPTEVRCLPILLRRMMEELPEQYSYLSEILPLLFFLDGQGDSFSRWCSLIKQQGSDPVIFVDGDKQKRVNQERATGRLNEVPIISLAQGKEFEELVPAEVYFAALKQETSCEDIHLETYEAWIQENRLPERMMFSKKVDFWLQAAFPNVYYDKPGVMRLAVERSPLSEIDLEPVRSLIEHIRRIVNR